MKIESKLHREGGTKIDLGGIEYHFAPQADGAHVAEVENDDHIARFLSIPEGFKIYKGAAAPVVETKTYANGTTATGPGPLPKEPPIEVLVGSSVHPATFEINGKSYTLGDVVAAAHTASGLAVEEWNALPDEDRHTRIDAELDKLAAGDPAAEMVELKAAYTAKFGKAPHHAMKADGIRAKLAE